MEKLITVLRGKEIGCYMLYVNDLRTTKLNIKADSNNMFHENTITYITYNQ